MTDYRRLTEKHIPDTEFCSGCSFYDDFNGCEIGGCDKYYMYFETYERLKKLEDMIESGELVHANDIKSENAALCVRLERSIELPFFQEDGEVIILIYKNNDGVVLTETYFEDEYYDGKRGNDAAKARFEEIRKDD